MMQVKNGELDALGVLFDRYNQRLFGFFYRLTSRRDISADLVQDVFERILRYRTSYTGNGDFATWLFQIARNRHADHYRQIEKEKVDAHTAVPKPVLADQLLPDSDDRMLLEQALDRLDPDKKQALVLSRIEGFLYREIAEIMSCTESAVKVRVFRGLQELRQIMSGLERQQGRKHIHPYNNTKK